ncbi:MAG: sugar phosphorylase [Anaerolineae bacterium]|nr:sugar phosphorylase [Anaerolineae bacterium]MDW8171717.1 sugar phosphorylase [Anaerolineae bacterium]
MTPQLRERIAELLKTIYGDATLLPRVEALIDQANIPPRSASAQEGPILIAYGDHVQAEGMKPLQALRHFARKYLKGLIDSVHLLPFYPYTSDDGFSVVDYMAVDPALGTWEDVQTIGQDFRLMFDLVLNHVSAGSAWFQAFLRGEAPYDQYFVTASPEDDLSAVVRPRTHPLLTPFETASGVRHVWTTFSTDQVDLNYAYPPVLLDMLKVLLDYVRLGADYVRLDAIAYLWKTIETPCIHLPQTHAVVQLMRAVLDAAAPWVKLITETNVPHHENITYFGDGLREAQMVYNFALPPLLLHSLLVGSAEALSAWAEGLQTPHRAARFFNFTASHDGIGVRPVSDILTPAQQQALIDHVLTRGGQVSYKANSDGSRSAYELNITYFDALAQADEPLETSVERFITSQAVMLALDGVAGIYLPSLFGASNWQEGFQQTGRARTLNRQKFRLDDLAVQLQTPGTRAQQVFSRYTLLLRQHAHIRAFQGDEPQRVLHLHPSVFALQRGPFLALHNLSAQSLVLDLPVGQVCYDLLSDSVCQDIVRLRSYQTAWFKVGMPI